jgi:hypothetical protein
MTNIDSVADLRKEIRRLQILKTEQEELISNDIRVINESLKPVSLLLNSASSLFSTSAEDSPLLKKGVNMTIGFIIDKLLMRNSNPITKFIVSFLAKNITANFVSKNSDTITEKIKGFISSLKDRFYPKANTFDKREVYNDY